MPFTCRLTDFLLTDCIQNLMQIYKFCMKAKHRISSNYRVSVLTYRVHRMPPHAPIPDAFTVTEQVGWTWDNIVFTDRHSFRVIVFTERRPCPRA
ncbi:hypothetical protein AVEN_30478-1 [Araneus ventricosus]|uniref:Uncharacterized protein n=1 Tax=Araneus ventricosus TaxID=182803 RepID=A0A4Y2QNZ2_ARAVE|nr:hypothetical protein AVEN_30478-1 [Araneus ventricosus]